MITIILIFITVLKLVRAALQAACDRVNRGFMARLYKTKAYRAVSLMATPYLLPFELAYILVRRSASTLCCFSYIFVLYGCVVDTAWLACFYWLSLIVALSVCLSVNLLVMSVYCAETADSVKMLFATMSWVSKKR